MTHGVAGHTSEGRQEGINDRTGRARPVLEYRPHEVSNPVEMRSSGLSSSQGHTFQSERVSSGTKKSAAAAGRATDGDAVSEPPPGGGVMVGSSGKCPARTYNINNQALDPAAEMNKKSNDPPSRGNNDRSNRFSLDGTRSPSCEDTRTAVAPPTVPSADEAIMSEKLREQEKLRDQLQKLVSEKLSTGNLDHAGTVALEALAKLPPAPRSHAPRKTQTGSAPSRSRGERRHVPPGVERLPKFSGKDPACLTDVLNRFHALVVSALPGSSPEQVNRALLRDLVFVLEGAALNFYRNLRGGGVDWGPSQAIQSQDNSHGCEARMKQPSTWTEVCEALHDHFLPAHGIARTAKSLLSLRQAPAEPVPNLARRHMGLIHHLNRLVDAHGGQISFWEALYIALFEQALRPDIRRMQEMEPPCSSFQMSVDRAERNAAARSDHASGLSALPAAPTATLATPAAAPLSNVGAAEPVSSSSQTGLDRAERTTATRTDSESSFTTHPDPPAATSTTSIAALPTQVGAAASQGMEETSSVRVVETLSSRNELAHSTSSEAAGPKAVHRTPTMIYPVFSTSASPEATKRVRKPTQGAGEAALESTDGSLEQSEPRDADGVVKVKWASQRASRSAHPANEPPSDSSSAGSTSRPDISTTWVNGAAACNLDQPSFVGQQHEQGAWAATDSFEPSDSGGSSVDHVETSVNSGTPPPRQAQNTEERPQSVVVRTLSDAEYVGGAASPKSPNKDFGKQNAKQKLKAAATHGKKRRRGPSLESDGLSRKAPVSSQAPLPSQGAGDPGSQPPCTIPQCRVVNRQFHASNDCFHHPINGAKNLERHRARRRKFIESKKNRATPKRGEGSTTAFMDDHRGSEAEFVHHRQGPWVESGEAAGCNRQRNSTMGSFPSKLLYGHGSNLGSGPRDDRRLSWYP